MKFPNKRLITLIMLFTTFLLTSPATTYSQDITLPQYDTSYYESFQQDIIGRIFFSEKYTRFELKKEAGAPKLRYEPNGNLNLGIGATYRNLTINLAYGFGFLNNDVEKGKLKKLDLQARLYGRKWAVDLYGQFYRNYYASPKGSWGAYNSSYYIRPDLKVDLVGFSAFKILNYKRFTLHPAFVQDEIQKKSAGSILAGASVYYGSLRGDSAIVPSGLSLFYDKRSIKTVRLFEVGPGLGYAYTQVLPFNVYLMASYTINLNLGLVYEIGTLQRTSHVSANVNMLYRIGGGYNNGNWNVNAFWVNSRFTAKGDAQGNDYLLNSGNYRIIFSKRILAGQGLKKILQPLNKWLPLK